MHATVAPWESKLRWILEPDISQHAADALLASAEQGRRAIDDAQTVSFDFFDTLVTRKSVYPEDVQQFIGQLLQQRFAKGDDFFSVRRYAEVAARERSGYRGDVDIDTIYQEIPRGQTWTPELIAAARELEETVEQSILVPRDDIVDLLRYAKSRGKRTLIVSDSYFQKAFFEDALRAMQLRDVVDEIYVSSDRQARKDTGALWALVSDVEQAARRRVIHFGDNVRSDLMQPAQHRIDGIYVMSPWVLLAAKGLPMPKRGDWRIGLMLGPLFARCGNSPYLRDDAIPGITIDDGHALGYLIFGPTLFQFMAWLFHHPALPAVETLHFLAREGYFLHRLYIGMGAKMPGLPRARYLQISRRTVLCVSQAVRFDPEFVVRTGGFDGTLEAFLAARLGINGTAFDTVADEGPYQEDTAMQLARVVSLPADEAFVLAFLRRHAATITRYAQSERDAFLRYCEREGLANDDCSALVDVGYSGTIQHALQRILGKPMIGLYMATTPKAEQVREEDGLAFGCFQDGVYADMRPVTSMHYTVMLEALLTAPHGQVTRFRADAAGDPYPEFAPEGLSQRHFGDLEQIFRGAEQYCSDMMAFGGPEIVDACADGLAPMTALFKMVFERTIAIDATVLSSLALEDSFSGNGDFRIEERFSAL